MHRFFTGPLRVEHLNIPIRDLPQSLNGLVLVQLSDLHFGGGYLSEQLLLEAIAATNRANPDLVVLTGDYIITEPSPIEPLAHYLSTLQSRTGIYAVLGNHDYLYYRGAHAKVTAALTAVGIQVLWDQIVYLWDSQVALVGLSDYEARGFNPVPVMTQIPSHLPRIVLAHNPASVRALAPWRVDLQLSGHTHGGQIVIPGLGPLLPYIATIRRWLTRPWQKQSPGLPPPP